jgi:rubrerythrin
MGYIMNTADIEKLNKTMDSMAQYELLLSEFYKQCAETWTKDKEFWLEIAHQEVHHADNIRMMQEIITKKPWRFEAGRPLNPAAITTVITYLQDVSKRLIAGEFCYEKLLIIAMDIEKSILEAHYSEIVKTQDVEYQTLMKRILEETHDHHQLIQQKLEAVKSKA